MNYVGYFQQINSGDNYSVTINTQDKNKATTKIELARNPVTISCISEDGIFSPVKSLGASIRIISNEVYEDMFTPTATGTTVTIVNETQNTTEFRGYLTANLYNQDYQGLDTIELEAVCALSVLKNVKYKRNQEVINWYDTIRSILKKVGYDKMVVALSYVMPKSTEHLLLGTYQFEGNFFDDDDEETPWSLYDILSEYCKYYCYTLTVINDVPYFVDYNSDGYYREYNLIDDSYKDIIIDKQYIINGESYLENNQRISLDDTYNKISVKANLYESDTVLHDIDEDLTNQNKDENKYYEQAIKINDNDYTYLNAFFNSKWWDTSRDNVEVTPDNMKNMIGDSFIQKCDSFLTEEQPSSLSWTTYITTYSNGTDLTKGNDMVFASYKEKKQMILNTGYLIVDMSYYFSDNIYANDCFREEVNDEVYRENKYTTGIENTMFPCRLYVGNYYYDGEQWVKKSEYQRKKAKGYYKYVFIGTFAPAPTWYKYKDSDGDWKFTNNKQEYDSATTEKKSGTYSDTNKVYYYEDEISKEKIYVDEEYWRESNLEDRFYLVRINKKDEKIFYEKKTLTNTVSYKMNLVDAEDGVAIKLPDHILNGNLTFEVCNPSVIGDYGQYSTDRPCTIVHAIHVDRLNLMYRTTGKMVNIFEGVKNEDVIYTNVINDEFVQDFDELELKINSQIEERVTSMSSMLCLDKDNNYTFLYESYDRVNGVERIQEESLVERYYNHYKVPRIILQINIKNEITPVFKIKEKNLNKIFVLDEYDIELEEDKISAKLIEL